MNHYNLTITLTAMLLFGACTTSTSTFDATGTFEADETIISAENSGTLLAFNIEEGQELKEGALIGLIDTTQLHLAKKQISAQMTAILGRKPDTYTQLISLNEQLKAADKEKVRLANLIQSDAATPRQMDDAEAQIEIIKGNIKAAKSTLNKTTKSLENETGPLLVQLEQVDDQIRRSILISPISGTVLSVYREPYEQVGMGMPLYKIADLSTLTLRAYITGNQLPQIKLNQRVKVLTDDGNGGYHEATGTIYWISDKSEFTPKSVQTRDERANKVYAIKVSVKNDGKYKIGMYGEVIF